MGSDIASINVVYMKDGKQTTRTIKFNGNFNFNIDDGNKKTQNFEGNYEVRNGKIYKDGKTVNAVELPTILAKQLIGMSNVEYGEQGYTCDDTYTEGDFSTIKGDATGLYKPGTKSDSWWTSDNINNRIRGMVGDKKVTGYYNTENGGFKTESSSGSVSIWLQK
jgi:hypothetical protein